MNTLKNLGTAHSKKALLLACIPGLGANVNFNFNVFDQRAVPDRDLIAESQINF